MKVHLTVQETLIWHDTPQLFVATDPVGGLHLCLAMEAKDEIPLYITVAISSGRLRLLKTDQIDLYSVFANPELGTWFQIKSFDDTHVVAEPLPELDKLPERWLPTPGELLHLPTSETPLLRPESFEAVKIGSVAKEAGMNPTLLRQYVSGVKRPSPEQARRVQDALHRLAQRLLEVRFV